MNPPAGSSPNHPPPRVGELLLAAGFISPDALDHGLARQRLENLKLGELIVELGMLDPADLAAVLAIQDDLRAGNAGQLVAMVNSRLGAILLASDCVSKEQLDHALQQLGPAGEQLGEILVRQGALSPAQLHGALAFQKHLASRRPDRFRLGRLLVESGDISEQTLLQAIAQQAISGKRLGEILQESGAISAAVLVAGLARQRRLIAAAMAAISFLLATAAPIDAAAGTATVQVSASLLSHASMRLAQMPQQLSITAADVAKGFVDLQQAIEFEVKTNVTGGCLVGIMLNSPAFVGAEVGGLRVGGGTGTLHISSGAPTLVVARQGQGMRSEVLSLQLRIQLAPDAAPGLVLMPVSLFLSPP